MRYRCGYCPELLDTLTDLSLHRAHVHRIYDGRYFQALERRYDRR